MLGAPMTAPYAKSQKTVATLTPCNLMLATKMLT